MKGKKFWAQKETKEKAQKEISFHKFFPSLFAFSTYKHEKW